MPLPKLLFCRCYGKYSLVANYSVNFDGDVYSGDMQITDGHEFNAESIFEVVFVDKGDNNFNWGYNGEGATQPVKYSTQPGVWYHLGKCDSFRSPTK